MEDLLAKLNGNRDDEIFVQDMMTKKVYVLNEDDNLDVARLLMDSIHIRHIPVVSEDDRFVGLVTHRDMLSWSVSSLAELDEKDQVEIHRSIPLQKVMNCNVETIDPTAPLKSAVEQIINNKYGCLPVVKDDRLVGIITEADFAKLTYRLLCLREEQRSGL